MNIKELFELFESAESFSDKITKAYKNEPENYEIKKHLIRHI